MNIRRADTGDIPEVLRLLSQVLEVHAAIRPEIFVSGTTKYNSKELSEMFADDRRPVYIAEAGDDKIAGYAFCQINEASGASTLIPRRQMYIDDICVDDKARGSHVGTALFEYVRNEAVRLECGEIVLNVWEGNEAARSFYEAMGMKPRKTQMEIILE